ncbi:MAG TPA: GDSL-type esterase/lipase family protein [Thermoanaerobaculia bacterium]|nr:GDSL-type esterase/lipase family protein [Thermoanaerobaculia bacterium]
MRRFLFWYLPITAALVATSVFAYGFIAYLRGDTGAPVDFIPRAAVPAEAAPRAQIAPIILGDSLARGAGDPSGLGIGGRLDDELRRRNVKARRTYNVAVNGARTPQLLELIDRPNVQQLLAQSNVIIVSIGGNDLWGGNDWRTATPPDPDAVMGDVLGRVESAIEKIRRANPKARIFFVGLYNPFVSTPAGKQFSALVNRWNARLLEHFGNDPDFTVVATADIFSHRDRLALDRFHPGAEGYELIARRIADAL